MEYVALYRKYRPKRLEDIYGQKYIVKIVENSILNNKFMHAYLFSGPRGTGKTTIAKLIAKIVNCSNLDGFNPCDKCDSCNLFNNNSNPDIIEIDAASNNGVDEIRTIRDSVLLMPSVSKYKVYIIDEVHMLSTSAFNALLKTLEEPPKHVIFILATTEVNKIPETILSRCQCLDFKRISSEDIVDCLSNICKKEGIDINDDVLHLIADYSNGGMRDSIGLLDKLLSYSSVINVDLFYDVVGLVDNNIIAELYQNIINANANGVFDLIERLVSSGKSVSLIVEQLLSYLKNISVVDSSNIGHDDFITIVDGISYIFNEIRNSYNELLFFEIEILKIINKIIDSNEMDKDNSNDQIISREIISESIVNKNIDSSNDDADLDKQKFEKKSENYDIIINNAFALANKDLKNEIVNKWNGFYDYVHNKEFSYLVSYFLDSSPEIVGEKDIIISADYDSIIENANKNITKLELLFNLVMGKSYNLVFVLNEECDKLKKKYISDVKSGKKYNYIEHKNENNVIIEEKSSDDVSDAVKEAQNVFGNDIVELK